MPPAYNLSGPVGRTPNFTEEGAETQKMFYRRGIEESGAMKCREALVIFQN
jgi:hypothetical protein